MIEFCSQLPDRVFWAGGQGRGLVRNGLREVLPAGVHNPDRKGLQRADLGYRVQREEAAISAQLDRLATQPLARDWLDLERMRAVLRQVTTEVTPATNADSATLLLRGLAMGQFLGRF